MRWQLPRQPLLVPLLRGPLLVSWLLLRQLLLLKLPRQPAVKEQPVLTPLLRLLDVRLWALLMAPAVQLRVGVDGWTWLH